VRKVLAAAVAGVFFGEDNHKFSKDVKDIASFVSDLWEAIRDTLKSFKTQYGDVLVADPLSGRDRYLRRWLAAA
jgi:hypothetical protein